MTHWLRPAIWGVVLAAALWVGLLWTWRRFAPVLLGGRGGQHDAGY